MIAEVALALERVVLYAHEYARRGIDATGMTLDDLCANPDVRARLDNFIPDEQGPELLRDATAPPDVRGASPYSQEVTEHIRSLDELNVYRHADLRESEVNGRTCLLHDDIAWDATDDDGRTNEERAEQGLAPLDAQGRPYELHHVGQKADSPLAELSFEEHRGKNMRVLHDSEACEIDRNHYNNTEKPGHWKERAKEHSQSLREVNG